MDIIFKGRHTEVLDRFRSQATAKLAKLEKLDHKAIRVDVEVTAEHNPRQSLRRERVELTISSRGPVIRAEAAASDRYAALDIAYAKLESRLRRACDRRKGRHGAHAAIRIIDLPASDQAVTVVGLDGEAQLQPADDADAGQVTAPDVVPVKMQGSGPLVVREKFHGACPMTIDQALFEMELVGHDFFLYRDISSGHPSVVYRRNGYQYGVIRLIDEVTEQASTARPAPAGAARTG